MKTQEQIKTENTVRDFWSKGMLAGMKNQAEQEKEEKISAADEKILNGKIKKINEAKKQNSFSETKYRAAAKARTLTGKLQSLREVKMKAFEQKKGEQKKAVAELKAQMAKLEKKVQDADNEISKGRTGDDGKTIKDFNTRKLVKRNQTVKNNLKNIKSNFLNKENQSPKAIETALMVVKNNSRLLDQAVKEKAYKEKLSKQQQRQLEFKQEKEENQKKEQKNYISLQRSRSKSMAMSFQR